MRKSICTAVSVYGLLTQKRLVDSIFRLVIDDLIKSKFQVAAEADFTLFMSKLDSKTTLAYKNDRKIQLWVPYWNRDSSLLRDLLSGLPWLSVKTVSYQSVLRIWHTRSSGSKVSFEGMEKPFRKSAFSIFACLVLLYISKHGKARFKAPRYRNGEFILSRFLKNTVKQILLCLSKWILW